MTLQTSYSSWVALKAGRLYRRIWTRWISGLRLNKATCQVLPLGHNDPMQSYRLGAERLKGCPEGKHLGMMVNSRLNTSQVCPAGQGQWHLACTSTGVAAGPGQ